MGTYVMSDIHGCYDELKEMFLKIKLSSEDNIIIAGDYIDRGAQNYEMLTWIENKPSNIMLLRGNHDEEFAYCIDLMEVMFKKENLSADSLEATEKIYEFLQELSKTKLSVGAFDYYGTIGKLIKKHKTTMEQLGRWSAIIKEMPYIYKNTMNEKNYIVVHAGYVEDISNADTEDVYETVEEFYLNARDDAYMCGEVQGGVVIAGHTPTIFESELPYNNGDVYSFYDEELDCKFYNVDCGCAYKNKCKTAKLACIRLEDEKIFMCKGGGFYAF